MRDILILVALIVVFMVIPIVLVFETYHWIRRKNEIKYPHLINLLIGFSFGVVVVYLIRSSPGGGEFGAAIASLAPVIFIPAYLFVGLVIGMFYAAFQRLIFRRKKK